MGEVIQYKTSGTCCGLMQIEIDNNKIQNAEFFGGCSGNLSGIKQLIIGMDINDVIAKFSGIRCGSKDTSCPDQLAQCLIAYQKELARK